MLMNSKLIIKSHHQTALLNSNDISVLCGTILQPRKPFPFPASSGHFHSASVANIHGFDCYICICFPGTWPHWPPQRQSLGGGGRRAGPSGPVGWGSGPATKHIPSVLEHWFIRGKSWTHEDTLSDLIMNFVCTQWNSTHTDACTSTHIHTYPSSDIWKTWGQTDTKTQTYTHRHHT